MTIFKFIPFGGGPGGSIDHFAPRYVVGNVPNGDSPVAYNLDGFRYFPDPGDGTGIAAALAAAAAAPLIGPNGNGDVWIRPGAYDFNNSAGTILGALTIPRGVTVRGAGSGNTIVFTLLSDGKPVDQGAFILSKESSLRDISIGTVPALESTGSAALVLLAGGGASLENVRVAFNGGDTGGTMKEGIRIEADENQTGARVSGCTVSGTDTGISICPSNGFLFSDVTITGCSMENIGQYGVFTLAAASRVRVENCKIESSAICVRLNSQDSVVSSCNLVGLSGIAALSDNIAMQGNVIQATGSSCYGIESYGGRCSIAGNSIKASGDGGRGVLTDGTGLVSPFMQTSITGNYVAADGVGSIGVLLGIGSNRCTLTGNTVEQFSIPDTAISCVADYCSITGNAAVSDFATPSPGIDVSGNNNVIVSNTTNSSGGPPLIVNTGAGNEIAHNI